MSDSQSSTGNAFSLFDEVHRPFLDSEKLKEKFLKLSAPLHPDRVHHLSIDEKKEATRRFSELNAAYLLLREPRARINLLLEIETGSKPKDIQKIPPGTMDLFVEVGQFCRDLDAFLSDHNPGETSPLLKVAAMRQQQAWLEKIREIKARVEGKNKATVAELQRLDEQWISSPDHKPILEKIENIGRLFSYFARWQEQLEEREIRLKTAFS